MRQATCSLACSSDSPRCAREFLRDLLARWNLERGVADDAQLLVSEVVANAVMHGQCDRTDMTVTLGDALLVTVSDAVPTPQLRVGEPGVDTAGGWGLYLVDSIADAWGTRVTATGKLVWFRLPAVPAKLGDTAGIG